VQNEWKNRKSGRYKNTSAIRILEVIPIKLARQSRKFDLYMNLVQSGFHFLDNDVLVISSKYVSISQGCLISLDRVKVSHKAIAISKKFHIQKELAEIILRESDCVLMGMPGYLLTIKDGILAPNAGIDRSNVPPGQVVLYPVNPFLLAKNLRLKFQINLGINLAIIFSDSRLMPTRIGTTGLAIAAAGLEPVEDQRGKKDLFGNVLRVTMKAIADDFATIGVMIMGESNESMPAVIIRGAQLKRTERDLTWRDMTIEPSQDIYMRNIACDFSR
jgi:coenzyme F420-0:L-glutamate ligase / coenzyme F420-1:gamma-L-glutamate ligase